MRPWSPSRRTAYHVPVRSPQRLQLDVREATAADALILADIERRCPIVMGDTSVWFDRGADYMTGPADGGLHHWPGVGGRRPGGGQLRRRARGARRRGAEEDDTVSHLRVLPEHQRKGLWGAANRCWRSTGTTSTAPTPTSRSTTSACSTASRTRRTSGRRSCSASSWTAPPWPVRRPAGRRRRPTLARSPRLNAFHGPRRCSSRTRRRASPAAGRAPDLYGWDRVWLTEARWSGSGQPANALRSITETNGQRTVSARRRPRLRLRPGAETELEALLRAWCAGLSAGVSIPW